MDKTNLNKPETILEHGGIDIIESNSKSDIDIYSVKENADETYDQSKIPKDIDENNISTSENSDKDELDDFEDEEMPKTNDSGIHETYESYNDKIEDRDLDEENIKRTSAQKNSADGSQFRFRLLGFTLIILGNIGLFLCGYNAVNLLVDSSKEKMKDHKTPIMLIGWIFIVLALYCQLPRESSKGSRARLL